MLDILKKIVSIRKEQPEVKQKQTIKKVTPIQKKKNIEKVKRNNKEKQVIDELKKLLNVK
jgi:hypothetical protein